MALTKVQIDKIKDTVRESLKNKFSTYEPETNAMPFHYRLLGRDRLALFSFIHSLNTTFGTSIFEPVAETLASARFAIAQKQFIVGDTITEQAQTEIQQIINEISIGKTPDKVKEIERIRKVVASGKTNKLKTVKVDLFVKNNNGTVYFFDLKTAKPNISNFKDFKRTLLEWIAIYLFQHPDADVHSYIAIPYNPSEKNKPSRDDITRS
jgi:type II restriction enzyme